MEIFEVLLTVSITAACTGLVSYAIGKRLISVAKDMVFDEFHAYIATEEGQQNVFTVGAVLGKGIQAGIGLKGAVKGKKLFGIPPQIWMPLAEKFLPQIIGTAQKSISGEAPSVSKVKSKFDS